MHSAMFPTRFLGRRRVSARRPAGAGLWYFASVRLLPFFLVTLFGCAPPSSAFGPSEDKGSKPLLCDLSATALAHGDASFPVEGARTIAPVAGFVRRLSEQKGATGAQNALFRVERATPALVIVRGVLSVQSAELSRAWLDLTDGTELEVALPDSESAPPLAVADAFLWLEGDRILLGRELSELGEATGAVSAAFASGEETASLLRAQCTPENPCTHAALRVHPQTTFESLLPLLRSLFAAQGGKGTLRLLVDEEQGSEAEDPEGTPAVKKGELSLSVLRESIEAQRATLVACHQGGREGPEALGGTVEVAFTVTTLGIVFDSSPVVDRSTIKDPEILNCVAEALTKIRFPKPAANSPQTYTVRF